MGIIRISNVGAIGVIKDIVPDELPIEAWSDAKNVRFESRYATKINGYERVYTYSIGATTVTQALAVSPWFIMPVETTEEQIIIYAGKDSVYAANQLSNRWRLTKPTSATFSSASKTVTVSTTTPVSYSATAAIRWNGCVLAGVPILNNAVNVPQAWLSATLADKNWLMDLQWDDSAGSSWADRTAGAVTCQVMRSYREYAIALNTTENSINYPRRVRWSHPAIPGAMPSTWDESRTDKDASYHDFEETTDIVVDGLQLRDLFVVYKQHSTWALQWTGGQYVMQVRQLFTTFGMLAANCCVEYMGRHVVLTDNDVVVHDGLSADSIIEEKWRETLFADINYTYYNNCFLTRNVEEDEIWICYPSISAGEPYWCDKALIWNWRHQTWYQRDIPKASHIVPGKISWGDDAAPIYTWQTVLGTWDGTVPISFSTWNKTALSLPIRSLIGAYPEDRSSTASGTLSPLSTSSLMRLNKTNAFDGSAITSYLIRESLTLTGQDKYGKARIDLQAYKHVKRIWPYIAAVDGTVIQISIGVQRRTQDLVIWNPPVSFVVGQMEFVNVRAMGRVISIKFENTSTAAWTMTGYDIEVEQAGRY